MLSAAELDDMAATLEESLPDSCDVVRAEKESDGAGGQRTVSVTLTTVACRVSPASTAVRNAEGVEVATIMSQAPWLITVPRGTDVVESDYVVRADGEDFEVSAVLGPRSYELGRRLLCRAVR